MTFDIVTFGEAMLRLSPLPGASFQDAGEVQLFVAGSEANVAVAMSSLGRSVAWISRLPSNPLGCLISESLETQSVDVSRVQWVRDGRVGLMFVESGPAGTSVTYDRAGSTASGMRWSEFARSLLGQARLIHVTGITPSLSQTCREVALNVAEVARASNALLSVDVNYRTKLWDANTAMTHIGALAQRADVLTCALRDARELFHTRSDPHAAAVEMAERFESDCVVLTDGAEGALMLHRGQVFEAPAVATTIVDRLGAGDALVAGVLDGVLDGEPERGLQRGVALAAIALATPGDQVALTRSELEKAKGTVQEHTSQDIHSQVKR
jgi:2-dehydro-3-deoxygluconokinase